MTADALEIRPAHAADLDGIFALERSIATAPHWPREVYRAMLEMHEGRPQRRLIVAVDQGGAQLLGFAAGSSAPTGQAELESVAVAAYACRRGIGAGLCAAVAAWAGTLGATELLLEVRASSAAAVGLYRKLGFEVAGRRMRYYSDPEDDALLMRLALPAFDAMTRKNLSR